MEELNKEIKEELLNLCIIGSAFQMILEAQ